MTDFLSVPCPCGSGSKFGECHGVTRSDLTILTPPPARDVDSVWSTCGACTVAGPYGTGTSPAVFSTGRSVHHPPGQLGSVCDVSQAHSSLDVVASLIARAPVTRKLDLACGQRPLEGFEGVDIFPGAQHVVDLQKYPWPFKDESVLEINCSHYIEHIPMRGVEWRDSSPFVPAEIIGREQSWFEQTYLDKDALFAFFDECYRILVPDGWLYIQVPCHRSDRAFQDPTHRRFITAQTFVYTNEEWRRANALDHYKVDCNFIGGCDPIVDASMNLRHPQAAQAAMNSQWNTILDWRARMQKKPRLPPKG